MNRGIRFKRLTFTKLPIYVIGYPKSGNTWLSRLLGDTLDSEMGGLPETTPICTGGLDRKGAFKIMQLHILPTYGGSDKNFIDVFDGKTLINIDKRQDEAIIHIVRDPRDVVISSMYYWQMSDLMLVLKKLIHGGSPLYRVGWPYFVSSWLTIPNIVLIRYEDLINDTASSLNQLLHTLGLTPKCNLYETINRQAIGNVKLDVQINESKYSYNKEIQLRHLRKGVVGDWKNHFKRKHIQLAREYFEDIMNGLGYTDWDI